MTRDEQFMAEAIRLAARARGRTRPNPMVGAVVVKDGRVVGRGFHKRAGGPHAEVFALDEAGSKARGATLYVNLEPCSFHGRTPPCAPRVAGSGVARVVIAMEDPHPRVSGRGIAILEEQGIEVVCGVLTERAARLNEVFVKYVTTGFPFVTLKSACTLDGKIATASGESQWISCEASRRRSHRMRGEMDGILVGIGTVLADDPRLTARWGRAPRQPRRIVIDRKLRTPTGARILEANEAGPTIVATLTGADLGKVEALERKGAEVLPFPPTPDGGLDFPELLRELGKREVTSLLIEGGAGVAAAILESGVVDKVLFFIAPIIVGGNRAPGPVGGEGIASLAEAVTLERMGVRRSGEDLMIEAYVTAAGEDGREVPSSPSI